MIFKKKDGKNMREYIKYENGKIVSIEVENPNAEFEKNYIPDEMDLEPKKKKPKWKSIDWNQFLTWNYLKKVLYILLIVLFIWTMVDIYKSFFTEETPSNRSEQPQHEQNHQNPEQPHIVSNEEDGKRKESPKTSTPSSNNKEKNSSKNISTDPQSLFIFTRNINNTLINTTKEEVDKMNRYISRKSNIIGFRNQIEKSYQQKEALYVHLVSSKSLFEENELSYLYRAIENRLVNSIAFSKKLYETIENRKSYADFTFIYDDFVQEDEQLRREITESMIRALKQYKIPYEYDEMTEELYFEIELPSQS